MCLDLVLERYKSFFFQIFFKKAFAQDFDMSENSMDTKTT